MMNRSQGATTLLGRPGFVVGVQMEVDGEWRLDVETTAEVVGCASCGTRAVGHGRRKVKICRRVGEDGDSVAQVARAFGVGWYTAMAAVKDHGTPRVDDPTRLEGTRALGLDETKYLSATRTHHTQYVTSFVDLQEAFLLDVVAGRSAKVVDDWLGGRPEEWLQAISVVAIDPFRGYANGLLAHLGHAGVVVDHFHAVRLANQAIDDVRRRVQNQTTGHRGRRGDPLYGIRRLALVAAERLSERGWGRLLAGLAAGDPDGEMGAAMLAKELLREVYGADGTAQAAGLEIPHCATPHPGHSLGAGVPFRKPNVASYTDPGGSVSYGFDTANELTSLIEPGGAKTT